MPLRYHSLKNSFYLWYDLKNANIASKTKYKICLLNHFDHEKYIFWISAIDLNNIIYEVYIQTSTYKHNFSL